MFLSDRILYYNMRLDLQTAIDICNPPFKLREITHDNKKFILIDESDLIGGSKQRVMSRMMRYLPENEIIYAGPKGGYAQIALAYCCRLIGKKATLFIDCDKNKLPPFTQNAARLGAAVHCIGASNIAGLQDAAKKYANENKNRRILPFGLNNKMSRDMYAKCMINLPKPRRLWVVAGSGLIVQSLALVMPNTKFMIVQVGKKIWPDQLEGIDHTLFISPLRFYEKYDGDMQYNSLRNYDAKVWPFIKQHGETGDFIWNTAGEPIKNINDEIIKIKNMITAHTQTIKKMAAKMSNIPQLNLAPAGAMIHVLRGAHTNGFNVRRIFSNNYLTSDGVSNHWTFNQRMLCLVNKYPNLSPIDNWKKNKEYIIEKAVYETGLIDTDYHSVMPECNTFNPIIMIAIYRALFNTLSVSILDPSAGWGDRLIAAIIVGASSYTGYDPNTSLHPCYKKIVADISPEFKAKTIPTKWKLDKENEYEFVFTSPPFFTYEIYNGSENDVATSYDEWIANLYDPYLRDMYAATKPNGYICVYIDNMGKYDMADKTKSILIDSGAKFLRRAIFIHDNIDPEGSFIPGKERSTWIFKKT